MKTLIKNGLLLGLLIAGSLGLNAQTTVDAEVPGDNFSLEGALELFKKSSSPEEFERLLNSSDSKVNNLDLNNDGTIDYLRIIDHNENNVHAFVIQAVLSSTESQDVAVIELEKLADGKATLQITGDADVYGIETIIEPTEEVRVNAGTSTAQTTVNVWAWPSVQYVYSPYYSMWYSPWSWAYHPIWWSPWRPVSFYVYSPWWRPYRSYYSLCYNHRIGYMSRVYNPYRTTSVIVYNSHRQQIDRYRSTHSGHDRYNGRSGDHHRYDGYASLSRSDYSHNNNNNSNYNNGGRRHSTTDNTSHNRYGNTHNNGSTSDRSSSRVSSGYRGSSDNRTSSYSQHSSSSRSANQSSHQRQSISSIHSMSSQPQRSSGSHSFGGGSGSRSSNSSGSRGSAGHSSGGHQRGGR